VQVEADGDLHIALTDASGDKPGIVVAEVPAKPQWREIRNTAFSWTSTRFPLHIRSTRKLTINQTPIITVIGKAFWDARHASRLRIVLTSGRDFFKTRRYQTDLNQAEDFSPLGSSSLPDPLVAQST
jgi:hypothetical protein